MKHDKTKAGKVEGEGSYEAARRYDSDVREFAAKGNVSKAATEAREAIDGAEGESLRDAERAGKHAAPAANGHHHLMDLERRYLQAMSDKDVKTALELTDQQVLVAGAQGVSAIDREKLGAMLEKSTWELHEFEIGDESVQMLSDDVALVAYSVHEELTVDGERLSVDLNDASAWVRRDGKWLRALHTEALKGDPFGRASH